MKDESSVHGLRTGCANAMSDQPAFPAEMCSLTACRVAAAGTLEQTQEGPLDLALAREMRPLSWPREHERCRDGAAKRRLAVTRDLLPGGGRFFRGERGLTLSNPQRVPICRAGAGAAPTELKEMPHV